MIKQKFKRALNGLLAAVMCVSTLTAVSYVQPTTASADNGNVYYNPALRWLQYNTNRVSTILVANALVTQTPAHCCNVNCPSNAAGGYYYGPHLDDNEVIHAEVYKDSDAKPDINGKHEADAGSDGTLAFYPKWYWVAETGQWTYARAIWNHPIIDKDDDGNPVYGDWEIIGYSHDGLTGDNTGTYYSRTQMTVYRTPEYTDTGVSGLGLMVNGSPIVGYGVGYDANNEGYIDRDVGIAYAGGSNGLPTLTSPRTENGQYTGKHFTATYCQACGIWNSADPGEMNNDGERTDRVLNNGNWYLNPCQMFDTKEGLNVKSEVTRTYGHGANAGKNAAGNATNDNDIQYHKSLDNQQTQACMYCFGTQKLKQGGDPRNDDDWESLNKEEDMYLYDEHEYHDWGIKTEVSSPYTLTITKTCNGDAIADFGCGYTETNIYEAKQFVNDYIGVVDGTAHYPQGALAEASLKNGGVGIIEGDAAEKTLTATLEWDDGEPPMRIIAGTATKGYTITYSFPEDYIDNKTGELTSSKKDADGKNNKYVGNVTTSVTGVATVTLTPTNMSYSNEGNKNYYNNNNATGGSGILSGLYGGLVANGWSGNVVTGGTGVVTGTGGSVATSALIEGYDYIIDTDAGIGTYAAYQPSSLDVPDPLHNDNMLHGMFIETGTCSMRGSYGTGDVSHACQYMYSNNGIDYWECIYCNHWLPIKTDSTIVYVHNHVYYKIDEIPATCVAKGKVYRKCVCGDIIIEDTPIDHSNHTGLAHVVSPDATCENDGYEYDKCTGCGAEMNGKMIPKLGHQWSIIGTTQGYGHNSSYVTQECSRCNKLQTISSSGTITSGGSVSGSGTVTTLGDHTAHNYVYKYDITEDDKIYQIWQCDVCGDTEKRLLEANGHHYEYKYTENDCTTGTYEIWQCTGCGEIERRMTAAASGHVWVEQSGGRESTCNINGFKNYICSKCGLTKVEMLPLDSTKHQHVSDVLDPAPTCLEAGRSYERCLDCGTNIANTYLAPLGHDYRELLDSEPTCFEKGYNVKQCSRCYEVVTVEKPQLDHHYVDTGIVNESQCTVEGLKELECEYCKTKKYESIAKTGHTPGTAATCTEDQTCTVCGAVLAKATGHNYVSNVVAPTCTTMGYTTHRCSTCGDTYVDSYTDTIDHDYRVVSTIAPTCTTMGYKVYKCSACGDEYKADYTDMLAHRYRADVTRPTCVESGYTTYTCMDCGTSYVGDITEPEGHTYRETTVPGNCAQPGHVTATCTKCGDSFVKEVGTATEDHVWKVVKTVAPTCTDQGHTEYKCDVCGATKIDDIVESLGHDWVETVTDGTCNTPEHRTKVCSRCNEVVVDEVGAITDNHDWEAVETKDATCTNQGYTKYKCRVCGNYKYDDWTDSFGHNYEWVVETEPTYDTPGVKAFKCSVCGDVFDRVTIPMLLSSGYTDEDGKQRVDGADNSYNITVTDENGRPVSGAEISVDSHDNIIVTLPDGRVISGDDKINVEVTIADDENVPPTSEPVVNKPTYVYDDKGGLSYGKTDDEGNYIAPNGSSTTGTGNNTAVITDDKGNTYEVAVTDERGRRVPDAIVKIGDSYDIDVTLPIGTQMDEDHRIVVTVTDRDGNPYVDKGVLVDAGRDNVQSGKTNADGRAVLPYSNQSYTNRDGKAYVNEYIVSTSNTEMVDNEWVENGVIANSLITVMDDGMILVKLPSGRYIRNSVYRTTVTVTDRDGSPASNIKVHVYDDTLERNEELQTGYTNSNGKIMVWPSWWDIQVIDPSDPVIPGVPIDERPIGRTDDPTVTPPPADDGGEDEPTNTTVHGDINGDGVVNHLDAINTMKYFMGMYQSDAEYSKDAAEEIWYDNTGKVVFDARVADVFAPDDDHTITHQDAIAMMKYFMGTLVSLPVDDTYEPINN